MLASLLWLIVAGEHVVERGMRVPLEFRNIPNQLEIVGDPPTSVDVRLRGSSALLGRIEPGEIVVVLDLKEARSGSRLIPIRNDEVRVPYGIEVAQIMPGTLPLTLEKSATRTLRVVPALDGDPAPGFVVGAVSSDPQTVEAIGPESRLKQLAAATTEEISIANARERVRDTVTIGIVDPAIRLVRQQSASVIVEILPAPVERELDGVPVRWRKLGPGLRAQVQPSLARVTIRGGRAALADALPGSVEAFVDLAGLGPGRYNLKVQVDPPQRFGISSIVPAAVGVTIR